MYTADAGQGWFNGQAYADPGMYEHPGNQFWGPTQQVTSLTAFVSSSVASLDVQRGDSHFSDSLCSVVISATVAILTCICKLKRAHAKCEWTSKTYSALEGGCMYARSKHFLMCH